MAILTTPPGPAFPWKMIAWFLYYLDASSPNFCWYKVTESDITTFLFDQARSSAKGGGVVWLENPSSNRSSPRWTRISRQIYLSTKKSISSNEPLEICLRKICPTQRSALVIYALGCGGNRRENRPTHLGETSGSTSLTDHRRA